MVVILLRFEFYCCSMFIFRIWVFVIGNCMFSGCEFVKGLKGDVGGNEVRWSLKFDYNNIFNVIFGRLKWGVLLGSWNLFLEEFENVYWSYVVWSW